MMVHTLRRYGPERSPTQTEYNTHKEAIELLRIDTHWQDHCVFSAFISVSGNGNPHVKININNTNELRQP